MAQSARSMPETARSDAVLIKDEMKVEGKAANDADLVFKLEPDTVENEPKDAKYLA